MPAPSYADDDVRRRVCQLRTEDDVPTAEYKDTIEGWCNGCERLVTWERWEGPVVVA